MQLGKIQKVKVEDIQGNDIYITDGESSLKLDYQRGENFQKGQEIEVFVYKENSGELIATTKEPLIQVGQVAKLSVISKTKIGYFVNIGMPKDVLLPFTEATERIREGGDYLFTMYVDKSERLAMTMNIKEHLSSKSPYEKNQNVKGTIYHIKPNLGALVAVDNQYDGLVPSKEFKGIYSVGDIIEGRIMQILPDGKLTLSLRELAHIQMGQDSDLILDLIRDYQGNLPIGDKSDPEDILDITGLSKSAFKRAVGKLYKEGKAIPGNYSTKGKQ